MATVPIIWVLGIVALTKYCKHYPHKLSVKDRRELAGVIVLGGFVWPPILGAMLFLGAVVGITKGVDATLQKFALFQDPGKALPAPKCRCIGGTDPCPLPPNEGVHR